MGSTCTRRHFLLSICILQLVTIIERQVLDFLGYMWAPIFVNFFHIIFVIFGFFGAYQLLPKYIVTYSVWNFIFIGWNAFLICFYLNVGELNRESDILNLGTGSYSWFLINGYGCKVTYSDNITSLDDPYRPRRPETVENCLLDYWLIEVIHSSVQCILAVIGIITALVVCRIFVEDDDRFHYMGGSVKNPQDTVVHPMYVSYNSLPTNNNTLSTHHHPAPASALHSYKRAVVVGHAGTTNSYNSSLSNSTSNAIECHKNFVNFNPNENLLRYAQQKNHATIHNRPGKVYDNNNKSGGEYGPVQVATATPTHLDSVASRRPVNGGSKSGSIASLASSVKCQTPIVVSPSQNNMQIIPNLLKHTNNRLSGNFNGASASGGGGGGGVMMDPSSHPTMRYQEMVANKRNSVIGNGSDFSDVSYYTNNDPVDLVDLYPQQQQQEHQYHMTEDMGDELPAYNSFNRANMLVNQGLKQADFYKMPADLIPRSPNLSNRRRNPNYVKNLNFCDQIRNPPAVYHPSQITNNQQPPRAKSQNQLQQVKRSLSNEPSLVGNNEQKLYRPMDNNDNNSWMGHNKYGDGGQWSAVIANGRHGAPSRPPVQRPANDMAEEHQLMNDFIMQKRAMRPRSYCSPNHYQPE